MHERADSESPDRSVQLGLWCTCAARRSLLDKVSHLTVTDEGAFGVLTVTMETDVWVQIALVHVCDGQMKIIHECSHRGD